MRKKKEMEEWREKGRTQIANISGIREVRNKKGNKRTL